MWKFRVLKRFSLKRTGLIAMTQCTCALARLFVKRCKFWEGFGLGCFQRVVRGQQSFDSSEEVLRIERLWLVGIRAKLQ